MTTPAPVPAHVYHRIAEDVGKRLTGRALDEHQVEGIIDGSYVHTHPTPSSKLIEHKVRAEALQYGLELDTKIGDE